MRPLIRPLCALFAVASIVLPAVSAAQERSVPVRTVAPPAVSKEHFAFPPDVRQLPNDRVLVNDMRGRRLLVFDSTLSTFTVSADSAGSSGTSYPMSFGRTPLIRYLGDSTLFIDFQARTFVVIGPDGKLGRAMAHPRSQDLMNVSIPFAGSPSTDTAGRYIYRAGSDGRPRPKPGDPPITATRDTIAIVRADFNTRAIDTLGTFSVPRYSSTVITPGANGKRTGTFTVNALPPGPDEWAVMADGTVAIVREHDYHVDWIAPNGAKSSTPKMPYDWRRLTDDDKRARIDSMKRVIDSVSAAGRPYGMTIFFGGQTEGGAAKVDTIIPTIRFAALDEMPDYVPPIRQGSARADEDDNLWILPTTSAQVGAGLLYDVVNRKGELFQRVRLPADFVIVGFGRGGVLYLGKNDAASKTWSLARTRVVTAPR